MSKVIVFSIIVLSFAIHSAYSIVCYDCNGLVATRDSCDIVRNTTKVWDCEGADICFSYIHTAANLERIIIRSCYTKGFCDNKGFCVECDSDLCNTVY